jgi:predicted transcriptional regulator
MGTTASTTASLQERGITGDELVRVLAALANPQRLRIVATLAGGRRYVSELARAIGLGRPLVHMHLQRLEAAGLVEGSLELSADGKAKKYFSALPFSFVLTPESLVQAAATLTTETSTTTRRTQ